MTPTNKAPGTADPHVGSSATRTGRGSSHIPADGVRDAARLGHLPCLRVGRHLRFSRVMLEGWLAEQFTSPAPPARAYPRPVNGSAGGRSNRGRFRRSTQAALMASLAENPRNKEIDDEQ